MTTITTLQTGSKLGQTSSGQLRLETVTMVVNFTETEMVNYFGGQVVLTADEDGISLSSTLDDFKKLAIEKAKSLIASSKVAEPKPLPEDNTETEETDELTEQKDENSKVTDGGTEEKAEETIE